MQNSDEKSRRVLYEDNLFREALKKVAILDGEKLIKENRELKSESAGVSIEKQREFKKRLDAAFHNKKTQERRLSRTRSIQKVAIIILIAIAALSISIFSVDAFRIKILNFFMEVKPEYTEFRLEEEDRNTTGSRIVDWEDAYIPTYIPDGYVVDSSENGKMTKSITLDNNEGKIIDYAQYTEDVSFNNDTEDATVKDTQVNGEAGSLIVKADHYSIIWKCGDSMFVVMTQIN